MAMLSRKSFATTSHELRGAPSHLQGRRIGSARPRSVVLKFINIQPSLPLTLPHCGVSRGNPVRASADAIGEEQLSQSRESEGEIALACPICHKTEFPVSSTTAASPTLSCKRCSRTFNSTDDFLDLTLTSGVEFKSYQVTVPPIASSMDCTT